VNNNKNKMSFIGCIFFKNLEKPEDKSVVGCFKYVRIIDLAFKNIELVSTISVVNIGSTIANGIDGKQSDIIVRHKLEI